MVGCIADGGGLDAANRLVVAAIASVQRKRPLSEMVSLDGRKGTTGDDADEPPKCCSGPVALNFGLSPRPGAAQAAPVVRRRRESATRPQSVRLRDVEADLGLGKERKQPQ